MTSAKVLVDTDVLIDFLRKKEKARELLGNASQTADLYCSVVTTAEILAGTRPSVKEATEGLLEGMTMIPVSESIARRGGDLRRSFTGILLPDCLIAATALEEGCLLLTFNRKDYPFPGLRFFIFRQSDQEGS